MDNYETWLSAHREELEAAYHGEGCLSGEPAPAMTMSFQVFAQGRYEQAQRGVRS